MTSTDRTPNGKVYMNNAGGLVPAYRDADGVVSVYVQSLRIWSSLGVPMHLFRPDPEPVADVVDVQAPDIEAGQTWISRKYGTDHEVSGPGGAPGTWEMWGPAGNLYVTTTADLYARYTLDLDR